MSFQVRNIETACRYGVLFLGAALLGVVWMAPGTVTADDGLYEQTSHGSPTSGAQRDVSLPKGSCAQCHEGHGDGLYDYGLWQANDNNLCFTCHSNSLRSYFGQTDYALSGHSISSSSFNNMPVGRCVQCHNVHGAGDGMGPYPHLTRSLEEENCFVCHGSGFRPDGADDVSTQVNKPYSHQPANFNRVHDDDAEITSLAVEPNPLLSGAGRHVECMDCHNIHYARSAPRQARSSNIAEIQLGSWGVRPTYSGIAWTEPTSYTVERFQDTATEYEYYLCLKCHSDWAWGNSPPYTADSTIQTNAAIEFNPANPAYHNVTGQASQNVPSHDTVFGSGNPPAYINGWGPNSAMACTDCHAGDPSAAGTEAPHGSNYGYLLKKRFKAQAGASDNTGNSGTQSDLCFDCHDWNTYGEGGNDGNGIGTNFREGNDNLHLEGTHVRRGCYYCHSAVPHGFKRKHMIVYVSDGPPYYQGDPTSRHGKKGGIEAYGHADGGDYTKNNCRAGCHSGHQMSNPVNPLP